VAVPGLSEGIGLGTDKGCELHTILGVALGKRLGITVRLSSDGAVLRAGDG
jgi:hypothetical protein